MFSTKNLFTWAFVMLAFVANAQPWTYDFGTTSAAAFSSTTASTTYLPAPLSGTARVRCGTATTTAGSFTLANPGEALGTGTELQMLSNAGNVSTTKFSVFDYTTGNTGYLKFKITFNGGTNGVYTCWVGDGITFSDNNAMTNAQIFAGLRWSLGASNGVTYTVSNTAGTFGTTGITNSTGLFVQNLATSYSVELYMNNTAASSTYGRSAVNYTVAAGTWDLWVDGVLVGDDLAKAGLTAGANFDSFAFNHQVNASAPGRIYLDDIEYSNALPAPAPCTAPSLQATNITSPGSTTNTLDVTWLNGDGAGRVVLMNTSSTFTAPTNGSNPTANLAWQNAGQQCVFNGTGSGPITVTGLLPSTTYHFAVYEYCTPTRNYNVNADTGNPNSQSTAAGASLSANALTPFGSQCVNGTYGPNSFTISGTNLTSADVTVSSALSVYEFATVAAGPYTSSLTLSQPGGAYTQDIYVRYLPVAAVTSSGNIVVGGGGASNANVAVSGTGINPAAPTLISPLSASITSSGATLTTSVTSVNCNDISARGVEWSTTNNFVNGTGTVVSESGVFGIGDFSVVLSGLPANTVIYWKAFATNTVSTTYTTQQTFTTSQEFLNAGDISILGINSNTPDNFAFVNWVDINPNMVIKFTDNGFNGVAPNSQTTPLNARSTENFVIWKNNTGAAIAAGTVIRIENNTTTAGQIVSGGLTGIASGDQVFAYQGSSTTGAFPDYAANGSSATTFNGNLLFGLNLQGGSGSVTWLVPSATANSNTSYLPTELATAGASITLGGSATGSQYTGTRSALGSILAYKNLVNNPANWTNAIGTTFVTLNTTPFTINPNVATQLAVVDINGGLNPSTNTAFSVTVEVRDVNGAAAAVGIDTDVTLTLASGSGSLSGTLTGTITAGSGSVIITGVLYNVAQGGVSVTASATNGQSLTSANSATFTVNETASQLVIVGIESFVYTNNAIPTFSVEARTPSNVLDLNYAGTATIAIVGGTGSLLGTITRPVTAGIATFNDIAIDEPGTKLLSVNSGVLIPDTTSNITVSTATLTEVILPQFIQGQTTSSNPNRLPFAYRVTLQGLKPNSTYRYYNSVVIATDGTTSNGAGNAIYAVQGGFIRSNSTGLSTPGSYAEFVSSSNGSYTGWFITEPTANSTRFAPGTNVFPRIILNNGGGGTAVALRLTTANSVKVLSLGATATDGTGLRGNSSAAGQNFVFCYDNVEGTGRPLSGTFIESDGSDNSLANSYSSFYANDVNGIEGAYGMIIPNTLPSGVRRLEGRDYASGELSGCASTDANGIWPGGTNTVNPTGGTSPRIILNSDAPLVPSIEVCGNDIDDDCDGLFDETCGAALGNNSPLYATIFSYSVNQSYPNCIPYQSTLVGATDSPESSNYSGFDRWLKITAQSTAISILLSSSTQDDAIGLYSRVGNSFILLDFENSSSGNSDTERLNYSGLTPGGEYYIAVGGDNAGPFSLCIQHLLRSWCAYTQPAGGYQLCSAFKSVYRGNSSNNVTYTFNFTETGGTEVAPFETASISTGTGLISLTSPALGIQYGGIYNVRVDVLYTLSNTQGAIEPITVLGQITDPNCTGVTIANHPLVEVSSTQRCPTSLYRYSYLSGTRVNGAPPICGALNYTYEFQQVVACVDGSPVNVASNFTTPSSSPYLQLGVLPEGVNAGAWDVRIRPNFSYGVGTFGPVQRIRVNGTSAAGELMYDEEAEAMRVMDLESVVIYPNPNNGESVNIEMSNKLDGQLHVRVLDASGRSVTTRVYTVEESHLTTLVFDEKLSAGVYMIELINAGQVQTQRMVVQ